ncbi:MAG: putative peptidoglycan lipid flippase [Candidatus Binatota bacterium]|nr:putative peptidoglycan lipid flippase [Candidatus Binatota bacterium]
MAEPRLRRSAGIVGVAVLGSRIAGLAREIVFATLFGAGRELDAFIAAFRIPNLFRDLFAEGALSAAFVPTFARTLDRDGQEAAWRLANRVLNGLLLVVGTITLLGVVFAPFLVDLIAPGFRSDPGKAELTILLARILFPFLLFIALAAVAMGVLNTFGVFGIPASASTFFNLGSIGVGLACATALAPDYVWAVGSRLFGHATAIPTDRAGPALVGMAIGTLAGGALQCLVQLPALVRAGFRYRLVAGFRDPAVAEILGLMAPATIGVAAVQVNVVVNTYFASTLGNGPVSWLSVAFRLMYLPIGMFGVALGTVALPSVVRAASRGDMEQFRRHVGEALRLVILLCVPAAVGLAVASRPVIAFIYEHGRFGPEDTRAAALALSAYAIGLTGYAAIKILGPAFYALKDAGTPMRVSLSSVFTNLVLNWSALNLLGLGHGGLALSTSLVALSNSAVLYRRLVRRMGSLDSDLFRHTTRTLLASALMGGVSWAWLAWLGRSPHTTAAELLRVVTVIPLGGGTFYAAGRALGIAELADLPSPRRWRATLLERRSP